MEDPIPLSALNQYSYCARRCYLIHAEQSFADNLHTLRGTAEHERVDAVFEDNRPNVRIERALPVYSNALGLSGRCDVVEFHADGLVYPVEYKHGKKRRWVNDDLQLAAQMMCLAEMLGVPVARGAVYHVQSKRRREVVLNAALSQQVSETAAAIRNLLQQPAAPAPTTETQRCGECSMNAICQPDVFRVQDRWHQMSGGLFDDD